MKKQILLLLLLGALPVLSMHFDPFMIDGQPIPMRLMPPMRNPRYVLFPDAPAAPLAVMRRARPDLNSLDNKPNERAPQGLPKPNFENDNRLYSPKSSTKKRKTTETPTNSLDFSSSESSEETPSIKPEKRKPAHFDKKAKMDFSNEEANEESSDLSDEFSE